MKLEWIECFLTVARTGSVNKSAEMLYLTQPTITKMIQALEGELDCKLFTRKKAGMEITNQGRMFYPYAKQISTAMAEYRTNRFQLCEEEGDRFCGKIELLCTGYLLHCYFNELSREIHHNFSMNAFNLVETNLNEILDLLLEDSNRVGIAIMQPELLQTIPDRLGHVIIDRSPTVYCVNRILGYQDNQVVEEGELKGRLINVGSGYSNEEHSDTLTSVITTSDMEVVKQMILSHDDVYTIMSQLTARKIFPNNEVSLLPVASPKGNLVLVMMYAKEMKQKAGGSVYLAELEKTLRKVFQ